MQKALFSIKKLKKNLHKMNNYLNYKMFLSHKTCADTDIFLLQVHLLLLGNTSTCYNFITVKRYFCYKFRFIKLKSHSLLRKMGCYCAHFQLCEAFDTCIFQFLGFKFSNIVCYSEKICRRLNFA